MKSVAAEREGFPGQHLVVLPFPLREKAIRHPLLKALLVTDAGYFPDAGGHEIERPIGAKTHLLIACLKGQGWFRGSDRMQKVNPGDVVWLSADTPHAYGASRENPWTIAWVHFAGSEALEWRRQLDWAGSQGVYATRLAADRIAELGLHRIYGSLEEGYSFAQLLTASTALRSAFCVLLQKVAHAEGTRSAGERTVSVRDMIVDDSARKFRLEELAAGASLSVPHFCLLFRKLTGYAPIDFVIRQRIRCACQRLDSTDESIATIASETGFEDPYYFSRCFSRVMGCSPRAYRSTEKA